MYELALFLPRRQPLETYWCDASAIAVGLGGYAPLGEALKRVLA